MLAILADATAIIRQCGGITRFMSLSCPGAAEAEAEEAAVYQAEAPAMAGL